ncbi:hypothetical protein [Yersinia mollaretii]|uniref:hypothetical protein n=1 Tax=Yersinia mollaretii TaxID=33060 RepID=UPI0011A4F2A0|nr:hypothetical protein [Yersinia mollaretii]
MMQNMTNSRSDLERYFRQTDKQCTAQTPWFARWLYIPVDERMQILDDLLQPYPAKQQQQQKKP